MKWVEAQISLSQSSWFMSNIACSRRLWRWLSFTKKLPSLIFIVVSISWNKFSFFALLWESKTSRPPLKDAKRWWGSELQEKLVLPQDLKKWIQMSGHVSVSKLLHSSLGRSLFGHKWTRSRILLNIRRVFVHSCTSYRKSPACQREFLGFDIRSADRHFPLVHCMWLNVAPNWMLCWKKKKMSELGQRKDWKTALKLFK